MRNEPRAENEVEVNQDAIIGLMFAMTCVNFLGLLWIGVRTERRTGNDQATSTRLSLIEQNFTNAPTHRDLRDLNAQINQLSSQLAGVSERLNQNTHMTQTIQRHLLEGEK